MAITITVPTIQSATITSNPASINEKVVIAVTVIEESKILYPEEYMSGEFVAGEV